MPIPPVSDRSGLFISHAHADAEIAGALREWLLAVLGVPPSSVTCTSHADAGLPAGADIRQAIHARLDRARALFLLATPASRGKDWVMHECGYATAATKEGLQLFVLTPTAAGVEAVPEPFRHTLAVVLSRGPELQTFARQLRTLLAADAPPVGEPYLASTLALLAQASDAEHDAAEAALVAAGAQLEAVRREHADLTDSLAHVLTQRDALQASITRARTHRTLAVAAALVALAIAGGLKWWREPQVVVATREAVEAALSRQVDEALDSASRSSLEAEQKRLELVRGLPLSGLVQDQHGRPVKCTQVSARIAPGAPDSRADCDPAGKFTFRPGELAADIDQVITLAVQLPNARYETSPISRATAPVTLSIRR